MYSAGGVGSWEFHLGGYDPRGYGPRGIVPGGVWSQVGYGPRGHCWTDKHV